MISSGVFPLVLGFLFDVGGWGEGLALVKEMVVSWDT